MTVIVLFCSTRRGGKEKAPPTGLVTPSVESRQIDSNPCFIVSQFPLLIALHSFFSWKIVEASNDERGLEKGTARTWRNASKAL